MPETWRIIQKDFIATAFDGEGAKLYGGRWNHPGDPVVYTSENLSMAALETFIHMPLPLPKQLKYVAFKITIPNNIKIELVEKLPKDINKTRDLGTDWLESNRTVALKVPSIIIPQENNILLNPIHKAFKKIKIHDAIEFNFDDRLLDKIK